ncbi:MULTISPECIES: MFS transporter [Gordonia]|uniref:MFS transporter n=1 Tax=Gordonia amicalis TaxID=89053 RepID=A0AAE4R8A5_9ACTN|nr:MULTISPECIES: MFS transporter [Gordonia]ATD73290.1 MFS transporter [Gordonia sp. 1D]MCZ4652586.1 MFS transporter [Gordonia amicalis]MDJ0454654.1 MFS transporter [Gordonia amicalis]MDV6309345.1 MFS transporter [Gordonia amicalis]MDV6313692.1 MFS transporter [Gordonia amicalis]
MTSTTPEVETGTAPARARAILIALILVAGVANINLAVANVALPDIGKDLDASSTQLNLIAVGYSLGLAASVLYFGALGDRHGRKRMLVFGMALSIPASLVAGLAPTIEVLFGARLVGGIAAGLAFPTTLAVITALWSGPRRTRAIAAWSAFGGAISALGPLMSGALLEVFSWHAVFLVTLPLAVLALAAAWRLVPTDTGDEAAVVDNLGGVVSIVMVGALVLAINFAPNGDQRLQVYILAVIAIVAGAGFVWRQLRVRVPLFDLRIAARRTFWVAAVGGLIVFGTLMGAMFIGQQYMQNVLDYSTLAAGATILPAAGAMVIVAPQSAKLVQSMGSRFTLLSGYAFIVAGLVFAMLTWDSHAHFWHVGLVYVLVGVGVGLAGTPASQSLTGSVPVQRAGMASSMSDLQRDLGGAILQSTLGAILTAGYANQLRETIAASPQADQITEQTETALTKSFSSAEVLAERYPQYADQIIGAARDAFVHGDNRAYGAAAVIVLAGAAIVFFFYPKHDGERAAMAEYAKQRSL